MLPTFFLAADSDHFEVTEPILVGVDKEMDGIMEPVQQSNKVHLQLYMILIIL